MADQKLANYLIWGIVATLIFLGGALLIDEVSTTYDLNTTDTSFQNTLGAVENITASTNDFKTYSDQIEDATDGQSFVASSFGTLFGTIGSTFGFMTTLVSELLQTLNLGTFGTSLGVAILSIFAIIVALLGATFIWRSNRGLI